MATPKKRTGYAVTTTAGRRYEFETLDLLNAWLTLHGKAPKKEEELTQNYRVTGDLGTLDNVPSLEAAQYLASNPNAYRDIIIEENKPRNTIIDNRDGLKIYSTQPSKQRRWASESLPIYLGQQPGIDVLQGKNYSPEYDRVFYSAPMGSELFGDLRQKGVERAWRTNPEYMHAMNQAGNTAGYIAASMFALPVATKYATATKLLGALGLLSTVPDVVNEVNNFIDEHSTPYSSSTEDYRKKRKNKGANVGTKTETPTGTLPEANTGTDTGTLNGTDAGANTETNAKANAGTQTGTQTELLTSTETANQTPNPNKDPEKKKEIVPGFLKNAYKSWRSGYQNGSYVGNFFRLFGRDLIIPELVGDYFLSKKISNLEGGDFKYRANLSKLSPIYWGYKGLNKGFNSLAEWLADDEKVEQHKLLISQKQILDSIKIYRDSLEKIANTPLPIDAFNNQNNSNDTVPVADI